jgi:hypothetical protein
MGNELKKAKRSPRICRQCVSGWVPGTPKTFHPGCKRCQEKLANGQRTGQEPFPEYIPNARMKKLSLDEFRSYRDRLDKARGAKQLAKVLMPY